ncbi:MAG: hypothetical protein EBZ47_10630, partial [Chlamydiae bacterium]|nr:hypothetical protein [Chlamydiota bacterium]
MRKYLQFLILFFALSIWGEDVFAQTSKYIYGDIKKNRSRDATDIPVEENAKRGIGKRSRKFRKRNLSNDFGYKRTVEELRARWHRFFHPHAFAPNTPERKNRASYETARSSKKYRGTKKLQPEQNSAEATGDKGDIKPARYRNNKEFTKNSRGSFRREEPTDNTPATEHSGDARRKKPRNNREFT